MQPTPPPIPPADIEADILRELLADDAAERRDGDVRRQLQTPEMRAEWPDLVAVDFTAEGMMTDHHLVYGDDLEERYGGYARLFQGAPKATGISLCDATGAASRIASSAL